MVGHALTVRSRRFVAVLLACVLIVVAAWRHGRGAGTGALSGAAAPNALAVAPIQPRSTATAGASALPASRPVVVDVAGAVHRPGLYRLPRGARVADAIARAGGLTRRAERTAVNLAAPVADGEQVLVAARGASSALAAPAGTAAAGSGAVPAAPVSLSTASAEELDTLPGVGPVTAQKIIAYREQHGPFTSVADLDAIPGIGPARLASLKGLVTP